MEDDTPEALRHELTTVRDELEKVRGFAQEDARHLHLAQMERDKAVAELRRVRRRWAMYYLDRSPIDLHGERGWPQEVLHLVETFKDHPVGRCLLCCKVAPLKSPEADGQFCAWPEGCDEDPLPPRRADVESVP